MKKSIINSGVGIITFLGTFIPVFILRKVFLESLGSEILGLSSLYTNILGYLSIIEMGIGSAIIYALYKPYADGNKKKIKGYLLYYEKFYKRTGIVVLLIGVLITPFIHLFIKDNIDLSIIRVGFILVLINTFIGYLFTYKHCILNVAQEGYKLSITITTAKVFIIIIQLIILKNDGGFIQYLFVQIIVNYIAYLILNKYIDYKFDWLKNTKGELNNEEKRDLNKNVNALFLHKIGGIFVLSTDNIVISYFLNLKIVATYNSYLLVINACIGVMWQGMNGISASIGNLLVSEDKEYSYEIHKKLFFINFWITSMISITVLNIIDQFITIWMGKEFRLDYFTLSIIVFNMYFQIMRDSVEKFKEASGEYYRDRYAPIFEGIINLVTSIILVNIIGLPGVFLGTTISNLSVVFWIKPKIVYKYVFNKPLKNYFYMYFKFFTIGLIPLIVTYYLTINLKMINSIDMFMWNGILNVVIINLIYIIIFYKNKNFIYFKNLIIKFLKYKFNKKKCSL